MSKPPIITDPELEKLRRENDEQHRKAQEAERRKREAEEEGGA